MTEPSEYAVRWGIRRDRYNQIHYSKWHWTTDGHFTSCGRLIPLMKDGVAEFPETDPEISRVDCRRCDKQKVIESYEHHPLSQLRISSRSNSSGVL